MGAVLTAATLFGGEVTEVIDLYGDSVIGSMVDYPSFFRPKPWLQESMSY